MARLVGAVAAVLLFSMSSASAKPTDGWNVRGLEKMAIEAKALELHVMVPHTGAHATLRKSLSRTRTLYCGVLRPRANPAIDVYFTAVVDLTTVESFEVDNDELGKVYRFCRNVDMSMP